MEWILLISILLLAAALRLSHLGISPPGLNVDEAANAWNSYCLLKTGADQHGVRWPIIDSEGFGQGMTTIYLYLLLPFQAIGGLNIVTTRLPAALGGILAVFLIYYVGKKLFDRWTGLLAAAFLALSPWHLQQSRWGHMSTIFPLLVLAPLAAMIWARLPFRDDQERPPDVIRAALAGALVGISCYGYYAARLWLPVFFIALVAVNWRAWWNRIRTRRGLLAIAGMLFFVAITFGPLAWKTLFSPLAWKRAEVTWVWNSSDSWALKAGKVLSRYPEHFGPEFLFTSGDPDYAYSPPSGYGLFYWHMLPLFLLGLFFVIPKARTSISARVLLAWVALYPAADLLSEHPTAHALRSLPGVCAMTLLAAAGLVYGVKWLLPRRRQLTLVIAAVFAFVFLIDNARFLTYFYSGFNDEPEKYSAGRPGLLEACEWLKPRLRDADAVFVTSTRISHPYMYTLFGLQYDPQQWIRDSKEFMDGPLPGGAYQSEKICLRYGKMHFLFMEFGQKALSAIMANQRPDRVILIVGPGESPLEKQIQPSYRVLDPQGRPYLLIFEVNL